MHDYVAVRGKHGTYGKKGYPVLFYHHRPKENGLPGDVFAFVPDERGDFYWHKTEELKMVRSASAILPDDAGWKPKKKPSVTGDLLALWSRVKGIGKKKEAPLEVVMPAPAPAKTRPGPSKA